MTVAQFVLFDDNLEHDTKCELKVIASIDNIDNSAKELLELVSIIEQSLGRPNDICYKAGVLSSLSSTLTNVVYQLKEIANET